MVSNAIVYLVGFPGVGKLTVARALSGPLRARVVDNHWINNPIFGLIDNDRVSPFPAGVWDQIAKVRDAVLETIATLGARDGNFILTHAGYDDDPDDHAFYEAVVGTARRRGAIFVPVTLLCAEAELARRVVSPEREARLKCMDPDAAVRESRTRKVLAFDHPNHLKLDTTTIGAADAAQRILAQVKAVAAAVSA